MSECSVCADTYNKITKKCVTCPKCNFQCCRSCIEKYTQSNQHDFHCMSCKSPWDYEFFLASMTKACIKRIELHRQDVLFEREKAKLPNTQVYVSYQKQIDADIEFVEILSLQYKSIIDIHKAMDESKKKLSHAALMLKNDNIKNIAIEMKEQCASNKKELKELDEQLIKYTRKINRWKNNFYMETNDNHEKKKEKTLKIISNCSESNCKGFIMSNWKCGLCETSFCAKCHRNKHKDHVCDENDVKTADMIMRSTKPCPTCATFIHKISGCSQMWCPECKTVFDYNTGEVDNGIIHNPHYYEWFKKNNKNTTQVQANQINCNRNINQFQVMNHINVAFRNNRQLVNQLMYYNRLYGHIRYEMNAFVILDENLEEHNLDLRISWMLDRITDAEFKQKLRMRDKKNKFMKNKKQILDMVQKIFNDIFHKLLACNSHEEASDIVAEFKSILKYGNECMENIGKLYGYVTSEIK